MSSDQSYIEMGERIVRAAQVHTLRLMQSLPQCQIGAAGMTSLELEKMAGFSTKDAQLENGLMTAVLYGMSDQGMIDIILPEAAGPRRFRLL